jgi:hypothetical protein
MLLLEQIHNKVEHYFSLVNICDFYLGAIVIVEDDVIDYLRTNTYRDIIDLEPDDKWF